MQRKFKVKKGDNVIIIAGNSKGQKGKVLEIFRDKNKAIVEGVNMISKHAKPNNDNPQGGVIKKEAPIHLSNLMIVDPASGEPSKIGRKISEKSGKLVRYAKKSGEEIK